MQIHQTLYDLFLNTQYFLPLELWEIVTGYNKLSILQRALTLVDLLTFPEKLDQVNYVDDNYSKAFYYELPSEKFWREWVFYYDEHTLLRMSYRYGYVDAMEDAIWSTWQSPSDDQVTDLWLFENGTEIRYLFYAKGIGYKSAIVNNRYDNRGIIEVGR